MGEKGAHFDLIHLGHGAYLRHEGIPALGGVGREALFNGEGDIEGVSQLFPELCGHEKTAFGIDGVLINTGHPYAPFPRALWDLITLCPTLRHLCCYYRGQGLKNQ